MSNMTRAAAATAAATGSALRDRTRCRTRAFGLPTRAETSNARFVVGGEPSSTALRATPGDDDTGRFGDDRHASRSPRDSRRRFVSRDPRDDRGYSSRDDDARPSNEANDERSWSPFSTSSSGSPRRGGGPPPDVTLLTQREIQALLPIGATGEQYAYFWGGPETATQRLGASLLGVVCFVNVSAALAVPASTFFLWAPVALAARRNASARRGRNIGLWRCFVLSCEPKASPPAPGFYDRAVDAPERWMLSLTVGDESGAVVDLRVPLRKSHVDIEPGQRVNVVVSSDDNYFRTFEAVREAYFPDSNTWVGEYPFLDRRVMPRISERVARDARARREWRLAEGRAPRGPSSAGETDDDVFYDEARPTD